MSLDNLGEFENKLVSIGNDAKELSEYFSGTVPIMSTEEYNGVHHLIDNYKNYLIELNGKILANQAFIREELSFKELALQREISDLESFFVKLTLQTADVHKELDTLAIKINQNKGKETLQSLSRKAANQYISIHPEALQGLSSIYHTLLEDPPTDGGRKKSNRHIKTKKRRNKSCMGS